MKLVIAGSSKEAEEIQTKFGSAHEYQVFHKHEIDQAVLDSTDVLFDFDPESGIQYYSKYLDSGALMIFVSAADISLNSVIISELGETGRVVGFNGLPGFVNRQYFEVSCFNNTDKLLKTTCKELDTEYLIVDDRVGMVTPRVIAMIINEAYFTVQEGTAQKEAIDQAMKLGTNYPYGPFEWSKKIGLEKVLDLLEAIYEDTKDERYKVCPLLKKEVNLTY